MSCCFQIMKKNILGGIVIFLVTIVLIIVVDEIFHPSKKQPIETMNNYQASSATLDTSGNLRK